MKSRCIDFELLSNSHIEIAMAASSKLVELNDDEKSEFKKINNKKMVKIGPSAFYKIISWVRFPC